MNCSADDTSTCGLNAACIESVCECNPGFYRPRDFVIEPLNNDCSINDVAIISIYAFFLVCSVVAVAIYSSFIERKSQAFRLIPFFVTGLVSVAFASQKIAEPSSKFVGVDGGLTLSYCIILSSFFLSLHVAFLKYLKVEINLSKLFDTEATLKNLRRKSSILNANTALGLLLDVLMVFSSVNHQGKDTFFSSEATRIIIRACFAGFALIILVLFVVIVQLTSYLIAKIDRASATKKSKFLQDSKKRLVGYRKTSIIFLGACFFGFLAASISLDVLNVWVYIVPFLFSLLAFGSVRILYWNKGDLSKRGLISFKKKESKNETPTPKNNPKIKRDNMI